MDIERNIAAKKTVSRPMQETSLQDNAHNDNVQNFVLQAADSEMVVGMKLPLNCKMIAHPVQETNPSSSGVMVLEGLEVAVIR